MALLGSLGFAGWITTAGRRQGGAVALTGLVTFLMLLGLTASPTPFEVPVLDRIADIFVLSLYTIGTTALLLPPPEPRAGRYSGPFCGRFAVSDRGLRIKGSRSPKVMSILCRALLRLRMHQEVTNGNGE